MARKQSSTNAEFNKPFPSALRTLMQERNTTQSELAEYINKTRQTISLYCNGSSAPDLETLAKIAKFFNTSTDYLLGLESDPAKKPSAVDELGLTTKVVDGIKHYKELGQWSLPGLNIFLEATLPTGLFDEIYMLKREIVSELDTKPSAIESEHAELYNKFGKVRGDAIVMHKLEDILIGQYPELEGRIAVRLSSFNLKEYYDGIIRLFKRCLDGITGYSNVVK